MAELTQEQIALLQKLAVESKGAMTFISGSSDDKAQGGYVVEVAMPEGGCQTFSPTDFLKIYQDSRDRSPKSGLNFLAVAPPRSEVFMLLDIAAKPLHDKLDNVLANLEPLPYHAICIDLILHKLGLTEADVDAHRAKLQKELADSETTNQLEQAIAQQVIDDAGGGAQA